MKTYLLKPLYWKVRFQLWFTKTDCYICYQLERYINWRVGKVQMAEKEAREKE